MFAHAHDSAVLLNVLHALALSLFTSRRIKLSKFTTPSRFAAKHRRTSKFPFVFSQKTFHIKTLIQYRILLQGDLGEVFIRHFITKWGCGAGAGYAECAGRAARASVPGAGWGRAASPATSRATSGAADTARSGAAPAAADPRPRPSRPGTRAAAAAGPSPTPPGAAAPGAAAPGTPTAPTAPPPARRIAGMRRAGTAASAPPGSPSPPASDCYCAGQGRKAAAVSARNVAPPTSTPSFPWKGTEPYFRHVNVCE